MNRSESVNEIAAALAKAQGKMKNPAFDAQNPHFRNRYATLAAVRDAITPHLSAEGISVIQSLRSSEAGVECETMLLHASGQWLSDVLCIPVSKHDAQGYGSASTYARRYSLQAFVNVVGDADDDGNAAVASAPLADNEWVQKIQQTASISGLEAIWKAMPADQRRLLTKEKDAAKARILDADATAVA